MGAKRQGAMPTRGAKKAKLDPVSAKIKEVLDALQREDCEVGGPPNWLEGLVAGFPLAMGLEAAKDVRHAYQEKLGNIVLEILQVTEAKFKESHKAARDEHAAAEAVKSAKEAAVTEAENALADQQKAESEAHEAYKSSSAAVIEAQKNLKDATSMVASFDSIQLEKEKDRAEYISALETEFQSLKAGTLEDAKAVHPVHDRDSLKVTLQDAKEKKALFSTVKAVLEKAGVDKSLILAAEPSLVKASDARGVFDNTVIEQIENALKAQVDSLTEEVNNGNSIKAGKVAEKEAAQAALTAAEATKDENLSKSSAAEAKTKELNANLNDAKESLKEQEKVVKDVDVKAFYQEAHAENFRDAILAFEFLRDRISTIPEVEAAKVAAMETDEVNLVAA